MACNIEKLIKDKEYKEALETLESLSQKESNLSRRLEDTLKIVDDFTSRNTDLLKVRDDLAKDMEQTGTLNQVIDGSNLKKKQIQELYNREATIETIKKYRPDIDENNMDFVNGMFNDPELEKLEIVSQADFDKVVKQKAEGERSRLKEALDRALEGFELVSNSGNKKLIDFLGRLAPVAYITGTNQFGILKRAGSKFLRTTNPRGKATHVNSVEENFEQLMAVRLKEYFDVVDDVFDRLNKQSTVDGDRFAGKNMFFEFDYKSREQYMSEEVWPYIQKIQRGEEILNVRAETQEVGDMIIDLLTKMNKEEFNAGVKTSLDPDEVSVETVMPRIIKTEKVQDFIARYNEKDLRRLVKKAIEDSQAEIVGVKAKNGQDLSEVIANGYTRQLINKAHGTPTGVSIMESIAEGNADKIAAAMKREKADLGVDVDDADIDKIFNSLKAQAEKDLGEGRKRKRMALNEEAEITLQDGTILRFKDLLETNPEVIMASEITRHSYRLGAGKNGIEDIDDFFTEAIEDLRLEAQQRNLTGTEEFDLSNEVLNAMWKEFTNQPQFNMSTRAQQVMRGIRSHSIIMTMGRLFYSQFMEMGKVKAYFGVKNMLRNIPEAFEAASLFKDNTLSKSQRSKKAREIQSIVGNVQTQKQTLAILGYEDNLSTLSGGKKIMDTVNRGLDKITRWAMKLNNGLDTRQRLLGHMAHMDQMIQYAFDPAQAKKLRNRNLSDNRLKMDNMDVEKLDSIADALRKYAKVSDSSLGGKKWESIDIDKFMSEDPEAFELLRNYMQKMKNRTFVQKRFSNLPLLQTNPLYKTVAQFKDYGIAAIQEELIYNGKNLDSVTASYLGYSLATGMMIYAASIYENSLIRDDADDYLKRMLTMDRMILASISRLGPAGPFTSAIDTFVALGGGDPLFDYRFSGLGSDVLSGIPTVSFVDNSAKAVKLLFSQDPMARQDIADPIGLFLPNHPIFNQFRKLTTDKLYEGQQD